MNVQTPARLNILTLEVRDLSKVRAFYEALGHTGARWEELGLRLFDVAG